VYSAGNIYEPGVAYKNFRGRSPNVQAMLKKKGLVGN
jgi:Zn-dependent oligopeptidase